MLAESGYLLEVVSLDKIVDGDTVHLSYNSPDKEHRRPIREVVRLSGIDAPELRQEYGVKSKQALTIITSAYAQQPDCRIVLETKGKKDHYGRVLGKLLIMNDTTGAVIDIQEEMLKGGHAWHYTQYDQTVEYTAAQKRAQQLRFGLWKTAESAPMEPWTWRQQSLRNKLEFSRAANKIGDACSEEKLALTEEERSELLEDDHETDARRVRRGLGLCGCFF